jgi:hypothetical protein
MYPTDTTAAMREEWIRRVIPWISTPEFHLFW